MSQLAGRRVLLTGALGTLGLAQAAAFAEAGTDTILLDLPEHAAKGAQVCANLRGTRYLGLDLNDLS
jgi:NAD(P)-dependent dehydrogenase (short-subunit alcohol dehydrogenase family)